MRKYIFKCFKTNRNKYLYSREINSLVRISDEDFRKFLDEKEKSEVLEKYEESGIIQQNLVKEIEHLYTDIVGYEVWNRCQQLTLQVTQQCNLRCEYCAYSGLYDNRKHADKYMTYEMAKEAIDFFLDHSQESTQITVGFYGGEPLLCFPLIKQCVEYIESIIEGKKILYAITTNGTLLDDKTVDYLVKHNFSLSISLDGSKQEHDLHRCFKSGKGSFDVLINNVKRLKERYPNYGKDVLFVPVITANGNLEHVINYFATNSILKENSVSFNPITTIGQKGELKKKTSFNKLDFQLVYDYEYLKVLLFLAGMYEEKKISQLVQRTEENYGQMYNRINGHDILGETTHHGGPCVPGVSRLFITTEGKLYPCEKVSETCSKNCIGDVQSGFDMKKVEEILNIGKITRDECIDCWALPNCDICVAKLDPLKGDTTKEIKLAACCEAKDDVMVRLYELAVLSEFGKVQKWNGVIFDE